ncbi:MAG: hypothetical protein HY231_08405 [Acidobacteria bacterium]|nr:hypothetical protein [Acidobacteriota bacterium]
MADQQGNLSAALGAGSATAMALRLQAVAAKKVAAAPLKTPVPDPEGREFLRRELRSQARRITLYLYF